MSKLMLPDEQLAGSSNAVFEAKAFYGTQPSAIPANLKKFTSDDGKA